MSNCLYPDWEGGLIRGKHKLDEDGFCVICGSKEKKHECPRCGGQMRYNRYSELYQCEDCDSWDGS